MIPAILSAVGALLAYGQWIALGAAALLVALFRGRAAAERARADAFEEALRQETVADDVQEDMGVLPDRELRERLHEWGRPVRGDAVRPDPGGDVR